MSRSTPPYTSSSSSINRGRRQDLYPHPYESLLTPEQHIRLDLQNYILRFSLGGLYPAPDKVQAALAPSGTSTPAILDLGTGSGAWALEMAEEFPHADVVGVDRNLPDHNPLPKPLPSNLRFEINDANRPLTRYAECFNLVHARSIDSGILDYGVFLNQVARMLRPGGIFIVSKCNLQLVGDNYVDLPNNGEGESGFTWLQKVLTTARECIQSRGGHEDGPLLWRPLLTNNPYFEYFTPRNVHIPIGPWQIKLNEQSRFIGELMRRNISAMLSKLRPVILAEEYQEEMVDRWIASARQELKDDLKAFAVWHYAWAIRTDAQWMPLNRNS